MTTTQKKSRIPEFKSYEEEAGFWDTHSFADYLDELRPVKVKFAKDAFKRELLTEIVGVRFDKPTINTLEQEAGKRGLSLTTLVRMWVLEKLSQQPLAS